LSIAETQPIIRETNSEFSGGNTGTARFSLYVSPYLVAGQGGKYTKHIYVGSQRIVSKLGDLASYGADPRRIPYAGNEADGLMVDYKKKYGEQLQAIKENYRTFDIPYNGQDNDDYVNGQGFCCNDGTPEAAQARAMARTRAASGNFKPNDEYEKMQFYYHPDHLGSSSYITNLDGEVSQHIEYVPFGEVFIEERNNTWNTPYLFNAKEFDEETGMYYYGARYYEPRVSLWISTDPMQAKYPHISTYCYANNNPIKFIDIDGCDWFINDQNFYVWSMNTQVSGFSYAGNILPSNVSRYQILENINGKYYHKYTSNVFASIGNFILGKSSFIEKKAYSHAEESFNNELVSQGAAIIAFSAVGRLGKAALSAFKAGGESVWALPWLERGLIIEEQLGKNLKGNFPVIDKFINGVATSIKSINLNAKSYQNGKALFSVLKKYINQVAKFKGQRWNGVTITEGDITKRALDVAIPKGASPSQVKALQEAAKFGKEKGVQVNIHVIQ